MIVVNDTKPTIISFKNLRIFNLKNTDLKVVFVKREFNLKQKLTKHFNGLTKMAFFKSGLGFTCQTT